METNKKRIRKAFEYQEEVFFGIQKAGFNVVTCGNCGSLLFLETKQEEVYCPFCEQEMDLSYFPDYWCTGDIDNEIERKMEQRKWKQG